MVGATRSSTKLAVPRAVLVVDDDPDIRSLVAKWVTGAEMRCIEASPAEHSLEDIVGLAGRADAVLLDVMMPKHDGWQVLQALRENPIAARVSVIILSAHATSDDDVVRAVGAGAIDHLRKPFSGPVLIAKVRAACDRTRRERVILRDLAAAQESALVDPLTQLQNRRALEQRLLQQTAHCVRHREPFAVVVIDIDHFKRINDEYGHEIGDRALVHFADGLRATVRAEDCAFRYGGEEFVLVLATCAAIGATRVVERLQKWLRENPVDPGDGPRALTFSAGVASTEPSNGFKTADLVPRADAAMYRAKTNGRDRVELE